jgi:branched-chain amino acid transport system substrate-binding protein
MAQEAYEMGIKDEVEYFGIENTKGADVSDNVQSEAIEGMTGTQPNPPTEKNTYQQFISDNQNQLDNDPSIWEAYYFDAAMLMSLAATGTDEYESETLRDVVYEISRPEGDVYNYQEFEDAASALSNGDPVNFDGVATNCDLDENGDVIGTYRKWTFEEGEFKNKEFIDVADNLS